MSEPTLTPTPDDAALAALRPLLAELLATDLDELSVAVDDAACAHHAVAGLSALARELAGTPATLTGEQLASLLEGPCSASFNVLDALSHWRGWVLRMKGVAALRASATAPATVPA